jgi:hypothetical protein
MMEDGANLPARSAVPMGLMAVRQHPGVETPGYCRVVPLGRQVVDSEPIQQFNDSRFTMQRIPPKD